MKEDVITNIFCEAIFRAFNYEGFMLDKNNILWKLVNGKWIGKRSVYTYDNRTCWLEDTTTENVKSWLVGGVSVDYSEVLHRQKYN